MNSPCTNIAKSTDSIITTCCYKLLQLSNTRSIFSQFFALKRQDPKIAWHHNASRSQKQRSKDHFTWFIRIYENIYKDSYHTVIRQLSGSHLAGVKQSSCSLQAVVRKLSDSHQVVIRQLSGSCQAFIRQSSYILQAVIRQLLGIVQAVDKQSSKKLQYCFGVRWIFYFSCRSTRKAFYL